MDSKTSNVKVYLLRWGSAHRIIVTLLLNCNKTNKLARHIYTTHIKLNNPCNITDFPPLPIKKTWRHGLFLDGLGYNLIIEFSRYQLWCLYCLAAKSGHTSKLKGLNKLYLNLKSYFYD